MIFEDDMGKYEICIQLLKEGKYKEAIAFAESLSNPVLQAPIFVDGGFALSKAGTVRRGTEIFENLLSSDQLELGFDKCPLLYNAANGRSSLYTLRRKRRKTTIPTNDDDLRAAKKHYRDALSFLNDMDRPFASQMLTNYGNCLSQFGRYIEAIEYYQKALEADPTNGMAAGNLGVELEHVAWLTGRYRHEYIALAYNLLIHALSPEMHLDFGTISAVKGFQITLDRLQSFMDAHKKPILPPQPIDVIARTKTQKRYIQFCIKEGLFLNSWVGNKELSPGITDDVSFGPITTPVDNNYLVPELLRVLNEIKEAFTAARYIYYLSQEQNNIFNDISKMTLYFGIEASDINGLYTGLRKTAYSRAFDVLDKTARITNIYFNIGKREDSFWRIFAEKQSLGEEHVIRYAAKPEICKADNYSLYALADLCIDYFESEHVDLKIIDTRRNRITHDYLSVRPSKLNIEKDDDNTIELDDLQSQTKSVLYLAKYAILYTVSAINIAESQKAKNFEGYAVDHPYLATPGTSYL